MSTKHNAKHPERGRSNYKARLSRRGLTKAPVMEFRGKPSLTPGCPRAQDRGPVGDGGL